MRDIHAKPSVAAARLPQPAPNIANVAHLSIPVRPDPVLTTAAFSFPKKCRYGCEFGVEFLISLLRTTWFS